MHVNVLRRACTGMLICATLSGCGDDPVEVELGCPSPLEASITQEALVAHMERFAEIGAAHDQTRAAGTPGFAASADYVVQVLEAAGYTVVRQEFTFDKFEILGPSVFAQIEPDPAEYVDGEDYLVASFSAAGDVTGSVTAVDLELGLGNASTSGCEDADFVGFPVGDIALVQRGNCPYRTKELNAAKAGAIGLMIFNQGNTAERMSPVTPRLSAAATLPTVGLGYELAVELSEASSMGLKIRLKVDSAVVDERTENILAERPGRVEDGVIMVGAHLDSVPAGPGINDNGSGSAAVLELGVQLGSCELQQPVRLAFWGAEELGLLGSASYVGDLSEAAIEAIAFYLNLDMVASPNTSRFLYDGDGSGFDDVGPDGSAQLEAALEEVYRARDLATLETPFDGRSDYGPFIAVGIAAGGIFTGAEGKKSEGEVGLFGGVADEAYDACYHRECDGLDNYDPAELLINARAAGEVVEAYAIGDAELPAVSVRSGGGVASHSVGRAKVARTRAAARMCGEDDS